MSRISKDPEVRKQEILETAVAVFFEKGYDKTKISDVAERLGIAQGLCYRYFPSKEALFDAAIEQYARLVTAPMRAVMSDVSLTLREKLERTPSFMETEQGHGVYDQAFHRHDHQSMHDLMSLKVCEIMVPCVTEALQQAADAGEIQVDDCDVTASFYVYGQLGILGDKSIEDERKVRMIRNFLLSVLL